MKFIAIIAAVLFLIPFSAKAEMTPIYDHADWKLYGENGKFVMVSTGERGAVASFTIDKANECRFGVLEILVGGPKGINGIRGARFAVKGKTYNGQISLLDAPGGKLLSATFEEPDGFVKWGGYDGEELRIDWNGGSTAFSTLGFLSVGIEMIDQCQSGN